MASVSAKLAARSEIGFDAREQRREKGALLVSSGITTLYLDVCALCRPFDDQRQLRTRAETDAVLLILRYIETGRYRAAVSPVHFREVGAIREPEERIEVTWMLKRLELPPIGYDLETARARADELTSAGLGLADAAHVAFAEQVADYFITCDDILLKKCRRLDLKVVPMNPLEFAAQGPEP